MNRLTNADRVRIVSCLVEGNSIRSTCRMTGFAKGTVLKLLAKMGQVCEWHHDSTVKGVRCQRVQADEIWSFCYAKDKNLPDSKRGMPGVGSIWTWTGLCADSKLMVSYMIGNRDTECAKVFMNDLVYRLANRVQLTTDGLKCYLVAVPDAFGFNVDYAVIEKVYGRSNEPETRYSPPVCIGCKRQGIIGRANRKHISTSYVERQNLTMRMQMRRFTRLTNAFSKKVANLRAAIALHFAYYNFCRVHQSLDKRTPAMAAGLATSPWSIEQLVGLLEQREAKAIADGEMKRGNYKPRVKRYTVHESTAAPSSLSRGNSN